VNQRATSFMSGILGADGARALAKAADRDQRVASALVPRAILGWMSLAARFNYEGQLPGCEDSVFTFRKAERGFSGQIKIGADVFKFENASVFHVASAVAVSLGIEDLALHPAVTQVTLQRLGKSIDTLIKMQVLEKSKNVRQQTSNLTPEQVQQRLSTYAAKTGFKVGAPRQPAGFVRGTIHPNPKQPISHELGHAFMTPEGETARQYTSQLAVDGEPENANLEDDEFGDAADAKDEADRQEDVASVMEAGIARRAGVRPEAVKTSYTPDPHKNPVYTSMTDDDTRAVQELHQDLLDSARYHQNRVDTGQVKFKQGRAVPGTSVNAKINARAQQAAVNKQYESLDSGDTQKTEMPGQANKPTAQQAPLAPQGPQLQPKQAQPPKMKAAMKITKAQSRQRCRMCSQPQFVDDQFQGCLCFRDLSKSVRVQKLEDGYSLRFMGSDWDQDTTAALLRSLWGR
jgi:hypothetical protein